MKISSTVREMYVKGNLAELCEAVEFYSGSIPASGDIAPTGVRLAVARKFMLAQIPGASNFGEFIWTSVSLGSVEAKPCDIDGNILTGVVQSMPAVATGVIGYAYLGSSYPAGSNPTGENTFRVYATVGTSAAEIIVPSLSVTVGSSVAINVMRLSLRSS